MGSELANYLGDQWGGVWNEVCESIDWLLERGRITFSDDGELHVRRRSRVAGAADGAQGAPSGGPGADAGGTPSESLAVPGGGAPADPRERRPGA